MKLDTRTTAGLLLAGTLLGGWMMREKLFFLLLGTVIPGATNPGHAKLPAVFVGPYDLEASLSQDHGLVWGDPAQAMDRVDLSMDKAQSLKTKAIEEAEGDGGKALDKLVALRHEPDGAQALFQAMDELARGRPAGIMQGALPPASPAKGQAETKPHLMIQAKAGESGIAHVARTANTLAATLGQKDQKPFDQILFEHAIKLMAFYGAPTPKGEGKVEGNALRAAPSGQVVRTPIDPEVRSVLRGLLSNRTTQVFGARALGQLGDLETAKEIISSPWKYPDASISDFGPDALEHYKQARKQAMTQGRGGGEGAFWQSMRIPPQHQDTAIELAMAGDGGAEMAVQRNWVQMYAAQKDLDSVWAGQIDAALRFPGSRAAWVGRYGAVEGFFKQPGAGPKTYAMILRAVEHDLQIIFSGQSWNAEDLLVLMEHSGILTGLWHVAHYNKGDLDKNESALQIKLEALFRKTYRPVTYPTNRSDTGRSGGIAFEMAVMAAHLKLKPLEFKDKKDWIRAAKRMGKGLTKSEVKYSSDTGGRFRSWGMLQVPCEMMGDIESVDKL